MPPKIVGQEAGTALATEIEGFIAIKCFWNALIVLFV